MSFELHAQLRADTAFVAALPLCDVLLMNDANYPWLILVPRVAGMRDIVDLDEDAQAVLMREIAVAARALRSQYRAHKLNVAALGNQVAQLHVHVIARQTDDAAWPNPVWGRVPAQPYDPAARDARLRELRAALQV
jgi:diadenosine tetraphosphate (Ap4A) HIT family hydrolase